MPAWQGDSLAVDENSLTLLSFWLGGELAVD